MQPGNVWEWLGKHLVSEDMVYGASMNGLFLYTTGDTVVMTIGSESAIFAPRDLPVMLKKLIRVCAVVARLRRERLFNRLQEIERIIKEKGVNGSLLEEVQSLKREVEICDRILKLEEVISQ